MKKFDPAERCEACGLAVLVLRAVVPVVGVPASAYHWAAAVGCAYSNGNPIPVPHIHLSCSACGNLVVRRPLDYAEPPPPPPPPPDSLDGILAELSRALLAQFPDGKGASLFAEVEKRLRALDEMRDELKRYNTEDAARTSFFSRLFGGGR